MKKLQEKLNIIVLPFFLALLCDSTGTFPDDVIKAMMMKLWSSIILLFKVIELQPLPLLSKPTQCLRKTRDKRQRQRFKVTMVLYILLKWLDLSFLIKNQVSTVYLNQHSISGQTRSIIMRDKDLICGLVYPSTTLLGFLE